MPVIRATTRLRIVLILLFILGAGVDRSLPAQGSGPLLFGVTPSNRLIVFFANNPSQILHSVTIGGLASGETIVGIDFRPVNRLLYAVGSTSQLYVVNYFDGSTIRLGGPISPPLTGTQFGVDVNPSADNIRIVSDAGMNMRVNLDTGARMGTDDSLAYAAGDPNAGQTPGIVAAAYTNPDTSPSTGTTLLDLDAALDVAASQIPANDGQLNTLGSVGIDIVNAGFDIIGRSDLYASLQTAGASTSFLVHHGASGLTQLGTIAGGEIVPSLAIYLGPPVTPSAEVVFAVNTANELLSFSANFPSVILTRQAVANLLTGDRIVGLDFRPANNLLYALGSSGQLYLVNPFNATAGRIGPGLPTAPAGVEFGFDFNPVADRIRVVSDAGVNLRMHPDTGALVAVDGHLAYAPGDPNEGVTPQVVGAAYLNPDRNPATDTTLIVIDAGLDVAAVQSPANAGVLQTLVTLGGDAGSVLGFDISERQILLVVSQGSGSPSLLFGVSGGAPRFLGGVGNAETIVALAISLGS